MNIRFLAAVAFAFAACTSSTPPVESKIDLDATAVDPGPTALRRLSQLQYRNTVRDLIGPEIIVPPQLEPDVNVNGLVSIGGSKATVSPLGVERYESAARKIAKQAVENSAVYGRIVPCKASGPGDANCFSKFVTTFGKRAWRRPLVKGEVDRLVDVGLKAATALGSFKEGAIYSMAAILQSPNFLFRAELGRSSAFDQWELASRLSYFLTNTLPDDELFAAAEQGVLVDPAEIRKQAERLMEKPEAREAVRNFFAELYDLNRLEFLTKDTKVFTFMDANLGLDAREETLKLIEYMVFEKNADFRNFFTSNETFVNRRLAAIYEVAAPVTEGFGRVQLPKSLGRRGFLGQVSFLALQSHPVATSAVLRGKFVRTVLLCGEIPPPPTGVNTGIPEANMNARTLRERSSVHQSDPVCASCHSRMDPIGLGFENFDSIGRWRTTDHDAPIDPKGDLDGKRFSSAYALAGVIASDPTLGPCLTRNVFRYAVGRVDEYEEEEFIAVLAKQFAQNGYRIKPLFIELASSMAFRTAGENP